MPYTQVLGFPPILLVTTPGLKSTSLYYHQKTDLAKAQPEAKIVYVTPERIAKSKKFITVLKKLYANGKLARIVIDEAHCVSQWGHDFRPDYLELKVFRKVFPTVPLLACKSLDRKSVV